MKTSLLGFLPLLLAIAAHAEAIREIERYPPGTFLESAAWDGEGTLFVTDHFGGLIRMVSPREGEIGIIDLDAHPVAIRRHGTRWLVSAHGVPFTDPEFGASPSLLLLDHEGTVTTEIALPDAMFLNGLLARGDTAFVADSLAGTVWSVDLVSGHVDAALTDPLLLPDPDATLFRPGANGIAMRDDEILISNSSRGVLLSVSEDWTDLHVVGATGPIDDFAVLDDGSVVFASHQDSVGRWTPDGTLDIVLESGCDGCTAIVGPENAAGREMIVLTTGKMLEGDALQARIIALSFDP